MPDIDIDIIIPIYNALADVEQCIVSNLANHEGFNLRLILVNDASGEETTEYLRYMDAQEARIHLIESDVNQGYSLSSNLGFEVSTAPYVVLMNSDTIVTPSWLERLLVCANSASDIGIVSPVTNAAIWQSVPYIPDSSLISTVNFPCVDEINAFAERVSNLSYSHYPELPYIHGYCQFIKREVLDMIGVIDAEAYPNGMGSELDFCYRAADAGYRSVVADDVFIFHGKAKSLNTDARQECDWYKSFSERYDHDRRMDSSEKIKNCAELDALRDGLSFDLYRESLNSNVPLHDYNIAFLLDDTKETHLRHVLLSTFKEWLKQGVRLNIFVPEALSQQVVKQCAVLLDAGLRCIEYEDDNQLLEHLKYYDVVIGDSTDSLTVLKMIQEKYPDELTVLVTDNALQDLDQEASDALKGCLCITDQVDQAKEISAKTGKYAYALNVLQNDLEDKSIFKLVLSLWHSEQERLSQQQAKVMRLLLQDAVLYHRNDLPPMVFSKGIPPLDQMNLIENHTVLARVAV